MKTIEPINVWIKGEIKTAELFRLRSTGDDLATRAEFYYELLEENTLVEPFIPYMIADGNISILGTDYSTWKANENPNEYAYTWAANQLNLVITTTP